MSAPVPISAMIFILNFFLLIFSQLKQQFEEVTSKRIANDIPMDIAMISAPVLNIIFQIL